MTRDSRLNVAEARWLNVAEARWLNVAEARWLNVAEARWLSEVEVILAPADFSKGHPSSRK